MLYTETKLNEKLMSIGAKTLIIGIDIAKDDHVARFVDRMGVEISKAIKFSNDREGFEAIVSRIQSICNEHGFCEIIPACEPTGHYWKALAYYLLKQLGTKIVLINPAHTLPGQSATAKKAKELDDNSQTRSPVPSRKIRS